MPRLLPLFLTVILFNSTLHADEGVLDKFRDVLRRDGTHIELEAVPDFLQRVFVPTVPEVENTFRVHGTTVDAIIEAPRGFVCERRDGMLVIKAPQGEAAGYVTVRLGQRELTLTVVNLIPYSLMRAGLLQGYRIGEYALMPLRGLRSYERPKGFMRLTAQNRELWVSDHYRLRDFQCKLDGATKFLLLRTEALVKLELLQHSLETRHGVHFRRFVIMSGYRTPYYNALIGNDTSHSRHLYGDAMDIYIDEDHDGVMDDVNHDGHIDAEDARFLLQVAEAIDKSKQWGWLKGGAGVYHANRAHGPYLHVDARGYVARWGV
jgi:Peptidase M15